MPINEFHTASSRQTALWILRALSPELGRRHFLLNSYADDDIARFLHLPKNLNPEAAFAEMDRLLAALESTSQSVCLPHRARSNIDRFTKTLGLNDAEAQVYGYLCWIELEPALLDAHRILEKLILHDPARFFSRVLDLPRDAISSALASSGRLRSSHLLMESNKHFRGSPIAVTKPEVARQLIGEDYNEESLLQAHGIFVPPSASLSASDFPNLASDLSLISSHLRQTVAHETRGVNVLLHGPPGTGKTELTRSIAHELSLPVYEVATSAKDRELLKPEQRLHTLDFAESFLANRPSLLVFDEAEDILEGTLASRSTASSHKGWFNQMLERNRWPIFWIANTIRGLDPAFARRFDIILEVPVPPREQRRQIAGNLIGDLVARNFADRIAECETIAPAVLERAGRVVRNTTLAEPAKSGFAEEILSRHLGQTLRAQGHPDPFSATFQSGLDDVFDISLLNTRHDLHAIAQFLRSDASARLCLHGPPGTGKTSFAHWLARELDRPVVSRTASDLLGPFVGMTEERIATAFEDANREGGILLLDEVDSFLADRNSARQSWEVTSVNEMLTRIDSFRGILIASTNRLDSLDEASLRRFDLKLHFDYLHGEQVVTLLDVHSHRLGLESPCAVTCSRARRIVHCTPGDFATVARSHRFAPLPNAEAFLSAVEDEISLRDCASRPIGFART